MHRTRHLTLPLLVAALLAGCGGEEDEGGETYTQRSVAEVVAAQPGTVDELVIVEGRAYPIPDIGFALADEEAAVLVAALPSEIAKLEDGEPVRVQGRVEEIEAGLALRLDQEATDARGLGLPADDDALAELQLDQGAPAIANPSITGEDGPGPGTDGG